MRYFFLTGFFLSSVFLYACKNTTSPTTYYSGNLTGNMVGYVIAQDTTFARSNQGVKISLDGTNFSTASDTNGRWELDNIPSGTYNISFTKEGYAMVKWVAYKFIGNGTDFLDLTSIPQIAQRKAAFVIRPFVDWNNLFYVNDTVTDSTGNSHVVEKLDTIVLPLGAATFSLRIYRNNPDEALQGNAMILFGKSDILSPLDPDSYSFEIDNAANGTQSPNTGYPFIIFRSNLLKAGFTSGDKIFCQAFVSNISSTHYSDLISNWMPFPSYFDIRKGKFIYTCFGNNHSEVKSFILP